LINVLDPDTHQKADTAAQVAITNGRGFIDNKNVIIKTVAVTGKVLGTDFKAYYNEDGSKAILEEIVAGSLGASAAVTFDETDPSLVEDDDIIGTYESATESRTGSYCIELIYQLLNVIPTLLLAPGWSDKKSIKDALLTRNLDINGHWDSTVFADMDTSAATATITAAKTWKTRTPMTANI
jgi:hypothetical protein